MQHRLLRDSGITLPVIRHPLPANTLRPGVTAIEAHCLPAYHLFRVNQRTLVLAACICTQNLFNIQLERPDITV
jgi:hypothetical protein